MAPGRVLREHLQAALVKLTAWRKGILVLGLVLMAVSVFLAWEEGYGHGYVGGEFWSYGVPVRESTLGIQTGGGIIFALLLVGLLAAPRALRSATPRRRAGVALGLAAAAWLVALVGTGSDHVTAGGVRMTVARGDGATMAAWGAFLVLAASALALRAEARAADK